MSFHDLIDLGTGTLAKRESRALILGFEASIRDIPGHMEGDCFPIRHIHAPGIYAREITLPVGTVLVGKIHRERHINFIERGHVQMFTEFGGLEELSGPCMLVSEPGTKRTVHVLEETVWTTVHHNPNNETDLEKLEALVIAPTFEQFDMKELT